MYETMRSKHALMLDTPLRRMNVLAALCLWFCFGSQAAGQPDALDQTLTAIDSKDFIDSLLGPASGVSGVEFQAERSPKVQYLLHNAAEAIPRMTRRLSDAGEIHYRLTPIVYFIVFKEAKDAHAMPALAAYLDSLVDNDSQWAAVYFEENPFAYAIEAIVTFIPLSLEVRADPFRYRHEIANELRAEFKRRSSKDQ